MTSIENIQPSIPALQEHRSLQEKLAEIHHNLQMRAPAVARIGIALYDPKNGRLKTFVHSTGGDTPLKHYEVALQDAPTLNALLKAREVRIVHDLKEFEGSKQEHTRRILEQGYRSSYTFPMIAADQASGFLFMDATETHYFRGEVLQWVDVHAHLITHVVLDDLRAVHMLLGALREANDLVHFRDPETGNHLERMSRYSRLIAQELARRGLQDFNDEYIENLFLFSPLHDVGKIGIPDNILLKPARLDDGELEIMRTHASKGREIIDAIVESFGLDQQQNMNILRNIAEFHHEAMDGSGYPHGLQGQEIPFEARIVSVADIFDALTSERPYKKAWANEHALEFLQTMAGRQLDASCIEALSARMDEVIAIQRQFADQPDD